MRKYAKEFAVLLLLLSLILSVSIGAFTVNAANTSTVTQVSSPLSYTQQDIFPAMKITSGKYNGHYAYCIQHSKAQPSGVDYKKNKATSAKLAYILANGLVTDSKHGKNRYQTDDTLKNYYITQFAVHIALGQVQIGSASGGIVTKTQNLLDDAEEYANNKTGKLTASKESVNFEASGSNYVTPWITVTATGMLNEWSHDLSKNPSGMKVETKDVSDKKKQFRLVIPKSSATENANPVLTVKATFPSVSGVSLIPTSGSYQNIALAEDLVSYTEKSVKITGNLEVSGKLKIHKDCENFDMSTQKSTYSSGSGYSFKITGKNCNKTVQTGSNGNITVTLALGEYTIKEVNTPSEFKVPDSKTAKVKTSETTTVKFKNELKKGKLKIHKDCEDFEVLAQKSTYPSGSGYSFKVSGNGYSQTLRTDTSGNITVTLLIGNYTINEENVPRKFRTPSAQSASIATDKTTELSFKNILKKGKVGFKKNCSYYGNLLVTGAVYGVYRSSDNALVERLTSGSDYVYTSKELLLDFKGYLQEITPAKYYSKDTTKYDFTITEDNQKLQLNVKNTPYSNVWPEFIVPNSDYRNGTNIIASYYIHNDSIAERRPNTGYGNVCPLEVVFTATDNTGKVVTQQTKSVNVPKFDQNLTYFKLKVPNNSKTLKFTCEIKTPKGTVETGKNHTATNNFEVQEVLNSNTDDTVFESKPTGFSLPSSSIKAPTGNLAKSITDKASYQIWEWSNSSFNLKTYGLQLKITNTVKADTAVKSQIKNGSNYEIKSGYGISQKLSSSMTSRNGMQFSNDYFLPQHANDYFPECGYKFTNKSYATFDFMGNGAFEMQKNEFATASDGKKDNRRIHFTPLWFPDGDYIVKSYVYDAWTPSGMLSFQTSNNSVKIKGDAYDDYFINHQDKYN